VSRYTLLVLSVALCAPSAYGDVLASHSPVHPSNAERVTFTAVPRESNTTVELAYEVLKLTATGNQLSQTVVTPMAVVRTCQDQPVNQGCTFTAAAAFPNHSLIRFRATQRRADGSAPVIDEYSFAAGTFPLPNRPIPIRATGRLLPRLDVVFVGDRDLTRPLRSSLADVLERNFRSRITEEHRGLFNFYYTAQTGHYSGGCDFDDPSNYTELSAASNVLVYLHRVDRRDCYDGNNRMSAELTSVATVLHEYGHALFGLRDEYCCDTKSRQQNCFPNVWNTKTACTNDPINAGRTCVRVKRILVNGQQYFWRTDPGSGTNECVMSGGVAFGRSCLRRVRWRFDSCRAGDCFEDCP
jgi:hypothetical protein